MPEPVTHVGCSIAERRRPELRRLAITLGVTVAFLAAEVAGGLLSRSLALLSDAGHMATDASALVLSLLAVAFAARPADRRRTYGYYRLEILAALANGVVLLGMAGVLVWQAVGRLAQPAPIRTGLMMAVAGVGLAANLVGVWLLHGLRSLNVRGAYLHLLTDTASSVAVLAGGLAMWLADGLWILDPLLGLAIAAAVVWGAWRLVRDAVEVLLEEVPTGIDADRVSSDMARLPNVREVHDLHIWTITSGMFALSAHLVVADTSAAMNDQLLTGVKEMLLREHRIAHSTIQIESCDYEHVGHVH